MISFPFFDDNNANTLHAIPGIVYHLCIVFYKVYIIILNKFVFLANFVLEPVGITGALGIILTPDS